MTLNDILRGKGAAVFSIAADATLAEAAQTLVEHKVGALLVFDRPIADAAQADAAGLPSGIITERDLLYSSAKQDCPLSSVRVSQVMTRDLITGAPDDPVEKAMGVMTSRRIRHLPVVAQGKLVGIISIGDIVKTQHDRLAMENRFMKDYIRG